MPYDPLPDLASLSLTEIAELAAARKLPPVSQWNPSISGDSEMRIAADGRWYHQGGEITRPAMVRAFSTLLRRDDDSYWLVTPQEKLSITVEDVPFLAVELQIKGAGRGASLAFRLNSDDVIIAGPDNAIMLRPYNGTDVPYIHIRDGLWARVTRAVHVEMMEQALACDAEKPRLWSQGCCFPMVLLG